MPPTVLGFSSFIDSRAESGMPLAALSDEPRSFSVCRTTSSSRSKASCVGTFAGSDPPFGGLAFVLRGSSVMESSAKDPVI